MISKCSHQRDIHAPPFSMLPLSISFFFMIIKLFMVARSPAKQFFEATSDSRYFLKCSTQLKSIWIWSLLKFRKFWRVVYYLFAYFFRKTRENSKDFWKWNHLKLESYSFRWYFYRKILSFKDSPNPMHGEHETQPFACLTRLPRLRPRILSTVIRIPQFGTQPFACLTRLPRLRPRILSTVIRIPQFGKTLSGLVISAKGVLKG